MLPFGELGYLHNERRPSVRQAYPNANLAPEALSALNLYYLAELLTPTRGYSEFIILTRPRVCTPFAVMIRSAIFLLQVRVSLALLISALVTRP